MHPSIEHVANQWNLLTGLVNKTYGDLKEDHHFARPETTGNSLHWLLGHITASRTYVAGLMGINEQKDWIEKFYGGGEPPSEDTKPSMAEILEQFNTVAQKMQKRFGELTEEELKVEPESEFPGQENSLRGALTFMAFHESYHLGQMHYVRRLLGYDRMFG